MKKIVFILFVLTTYLFNILYAQTKQEFPLIPYPQKLVVRKGNFTLGRETSVIYKTDFPETENDFITALKKEFSIHVNNSKKGKIIQYTYNNSLAKEAYRIHLTKDSIIVLAGSGAGAFYASETLKQLLYFNSPQHNISFPLLDIYDQPKYAWRGFMLDLSRHFFTVEYLKKTIDRMSFYKANKLHLHLSDDQGWRIEIKQYPLLTKIGAWRNLDKNDTACIQKSKENPDFTIDHRMIKNIDGKMVYGGFYTQAQIRDLVAYAAQKNIEIIPEIDMPGHFSAATRAYPFLTGTSKAGWGETFSIPINPCQENVYVFTQNILKEIFALFPSKYIHIGADEVEKTTWKNNEACQKLMVDSNIGSPNHLQSYFIHRMQRFVESHGKKLITWDDALEGGIDSNIIVMYWRTWVKKAPAEALKNGNHLIMTPNEPFYFDYPPDKNSLFNVYHSKITTENEDGNKLLLGGQANLWSEMVPSENRADYLIFPRYIALAENLWTNDTNRYTSFERRLSIQYALLDRMGIHYRLQDLTGFAENNVFVDQTTLKIQSSPNSNLHIHYTLDGSLPTAQSSFLNKEGLIINKDTTVKVAAFNSVGSRGDIYTIHYKKEQYKQAILIDTLLSSGLHVDYYKGFFNGTSRIKQTADSSFVNENFTVPTSINAPSFALDYKGYVKIPETGIYSFYLTCDDAGILKIDNEMVVDNDGMHSSVEKSGQAALFRGIHPLLLRFVEGGGGFHLKLQYSFNNSPIQDIPNSWLLN